MSARGLCRIADVGGFAGWPALPPPQQEGLVLLAGAEVSNGRPRASRLRFAVLRGVLHAVEVLSSPPGSQAETLLPWSAGRCIAAATSNAPLSIARSFMPGSPGARSPQCRDDRPRSRPVGLPEAGAAAVRTAPVRHCRPPGRRASRTAGRAGRMRKKTARSAVPSMRQAWAGVVCRAGRSARPCSARWLWPAPSLRRPDLGCARPRRACGTA